MVTPDAHAIRSALRCERGCDQCLRPDGRRHCPAHDDTHASLSINERNGRVLVYDHSGTCSQEAVLQALRERNLWPSRNGPTQTTRHALSDVDGRHIADHVRSDQPGSEKSFRWQRPDGTAGLGGLRVADLPLYGVHLLRDQPDAPVIVTEGEKAAKALLDAGRLAVGTVTGAGATPSLNSLRPLAGRDIFLWPDADDAGRAHMNRIAVQLHTLGVTPRLIVWADAPPKGDGADFVARHGTGETLDQLLAGGQKVSAAYRDVVPAESNLRFRTGAEIGSTPGLEVQYVAWPLAVRGAITELDGKVKSSGKTTLLTHAALAVLDGQEFLGHPTLGTPVVYLTEQTPASFREAMRRAGLLGREDFTVLFWHDTVGVSWQGVVRAAVAECTRVDAHWLIVDTLPQFAGLTGDDENKSGDALAAMQPLQKAASAGLAVTVSRHERKSGGNVGDSGRGSSAFAGAVDVVLALRRSEGNTRKSIRVIHALSRFEDTPEELMVELTPEGYVALGDSESVAIEEAIGKILAAVPVTEGDALAQKDLFEQADVKRTSGQEALKKLLEDGLLVCLGAGKRSDPHRYWRPETPQKVSAATTSPIAAERNSGGKVNGETRPLPPLAEAARKMFDAEVIADTEVHS